MSSTNYNDSTIRISDGQSKAASSVWQKTVSYHEHSNTRSCPGSEIRLKCGARLGRSKQRCLSTRLGRWPTPSLRDLEPIRLRFRPGWLSSKHWLARKAGSQLALSKVGERSLRCSGAHTDWIDLYPLNPLTVSKFREALFTSAPRMIRLTAN